MESFLLWQILFLMFVGALRAAAVDNMTTAAVTDVTVTTGTVNITDNSTTATTKAPVTAVEIIPRFVVSDGDGVCILALLIAELTIEYETTEGQTREVKFPLSSNAIQGGQCSASPSYKRKLIIGLPPRPNATSSPGIIFNFDASSSTAYTLTKLEIAWSYNEAFFPHAKKAGQYGSLVFENAITGTIGKTFKCNETGYFTVGGGVVMKHVMMQPYAEYSKDKGNFGEVEDCDSPQPTTVAPTTTKPPLPTPTKAAHINVGMIVGIAVGAFAAIVVIIIIIVCVVKKRQQKQVSYGNLTN